MDRDIVLSKADKHLVQYKQMCKAIAVCHGFDECKDIVDKSVAMAAYYKQINDSKTVLMFHRVRARAWRRIGELVASAVKFYDGETQVARVKKVRAAFPDDSTVADMSDARIIEIMRLMEISDADFEHAIQQEINGSIVDLLRRTPAHEAWVAANHRATAAAAKQNEQYAKGQQAEFAKQQAEDAKQRAREDRHFDELAEAAAVAMRDVGITLERKDRANMKQVVFLIKEEVHAVMRQAAFDKRITMQEVLRRGLKLWLEANGYDFPDDEPSRPKPDNKATGASL